MTDIPGKRARTDGVRRVWSWALALLAFATACAALPTEHEAEIQPRSPKGEFEESSADAYAIAVFPLPHTGTAAVSPVESTAQVVADLARIAGFDLSLAEILELLVGGFMAAKHGPRLLGWFTPQAGPVAAGSVGGSVAAVALPLGGTALAVDALHEAIDTDVHKFLRIWATGDPEGPRCRAREEFRGLLHGGSEQFAACVTPQTIRMLLDAELLRPSGAPGGMTAYYPTTVFSPDAPAQDCRSIRDDLEGLKERCEAMEMILEIAQADLEWQQLGDHVRGLAGAAIEPHWKAEVDQDQSKTPKCERVKALRAATPQSVAVPCIQSWHFCATLFVCVDKATGAAVTSARSLAVPRVQWLRSQAANLRLESITTRVGMSDPRWPARVSPRLHVRLVISPDSGGARVFGFAAHAWEWGTLPGQKASGLKPEEYELVRQTYLGRDWARQWGGKLPGFVYRKRLSNWLEISEVQPDPFAFRRAYLFAVGTRRASTLLGPSGPLSEGSIIVVPSETSEKDGEDALRSRAQVLSHQGEGVTRVYSGGTL